MLPVIIKAESVRLSDKLRDVLSHLFCISQGAGIYWLCKQTVQSGSGSFAASGSAAASGSTSVKPDLTSSVMASNSGIPGSCLGLCSGAGFTLGQIRVGQAGLHESVAWDESFLQAYPELQGLKVTLNLQPVKPGLAISESILDKPVPYALFVEQAIPDKTLARAHGSSVNPSATSSASFSANVGASFSANASASFSTNPDSTLGADIALAQGVGADLSQASDVVLAQARSGLAQNTEIALVKSDNLGSLRQEIDDIDDQLAELLARRQEIVKQAAVLKHQAGEGMVSSQRELKILEHGAALEERFNLPSHLMQDIQRRILRQSYKEKGSGQYTCAYPQGICTVVMVGGAGGMARLFAGYLKGSNYRVLSIEKDDYTVDENGQAVNDMQHSRAAAYLRQANWCIVSVPIDVTAKVIAQICPYLSSECILSDFTSIKAKPLEVMLKHHPGPVLGLHPMFGPDTASLVRQVIVAVAGRKMEQCQFILAQFKLYGASVVECSALEHDQAMRVIQALRHFTTFAYGVFLEKIAEHYRTSALAASQPKPQSQPQTQLQPQAKSQVETSSQVQAETLVQAQVQAQSLVQAQAQVGAQIQAQSGAQALNDAVNQARNQEGKQEGNQADKPGVSGVGTETLGGNSFVTRLLQLSSPIYHLELMMVGRLFAQDPHLYCDIISASCENLKLIREYLDCASECLAVLECNDKAKFVSDFEHTRAFFGDYATRFLHESADILAKAQDNYPVESE